VRLPFLVEEKNMVQEICKKCGNPGEVANFDLTEILCINCDALFAAWLEKFPNVKFAEFLNI
jgi:hypothetical protein